MGISLEEANKLLSNKKGISLEEANAMLSGANPGFGEQMDAAISDIPRQAGLTLRHGTEGLAETAGIFSDPLAYLINKSLGTDFPTARNAASGVLDYAGVPQPNSPLERGVGDASRVLAGTGGMIKAAGALAPSSETTKSVVRSLVSRPDVQAASAIGSGGAGSYVRETGGSPTSQFIASIAGGVASPLAYSGGKYAAKQIGNAAKDFYQSFIPTTPELSVEVKNAINNSGIDMSKLSNQAKNALLEDIQKALKGGGTLQPEAINRLAAYRSLGATPTVGTIGLDPAVLTQQKNLAKVGAGSPDPRLQQLAQVQRSNDTTLVDNLNRVADTSKDAYSGGQNIINSLQGKVDANKNNINALYKNARDTSGRSANLDPSVFTNRANDLLDEHMVGDLIGGDVRNKLNAIAKGEIPFTVDVAEQLKTNISTLQRNMSFDKRSEKFALGLIRKALDETPLLESNGQGAIDAFSAARNANRVWMAKVEKTPALKAVMEGVEPDKFVQDFIIGNGKNANVMDLFQLRRQLKNDPEAINSVRGQIILHFKEQALGKNVPDDMANFSAAGYRKALGNIGDRKLGAFFSKDEIRTLKDIATVATAEKFQPTGSAINNSNSATTAASFFVNALDGLANTKFGAFMPGKNVIASVKAGQALDVPRSLVVKPPREPVAPSLIFPSLMLLQGGLLSAE